MLAGRYCLPMCGCGSALELEFVSSHIARCGEDAVHDKRTSADEKMVDHPSWNGLCGRIKAKPEVADLQLGGARRWLADVGAEAWLCVCGKDAWREGARSFPCSGLASFMMPLRKCIFRFEHAH